MCVHEIISVIFILQTEYTYNLTQKIYSVWDTEVWDIQIMLLQLGLKFFPKKIFLKIRFVTKMFKQTYKCFGMYPWTVKFKIKIPFHQTI